MRDEKVIPLVGPGSRKRRKKPSLDEKLQRAGACPVQALGHDAGQYFYITPSAQMREFADRHHREQQLDALFDGNVEWPCRAFAKCSSHGDPVGHNEAELRRYLMRQCVVQGFFVSARSLRGPGVWRDDNEGLIVHAGNKLLIDGRWYATSRGIGTIIDQMLDRYLALPDEVVDATGARDFPLVPIHGVRR